MRIRLTGTPAECAAGVAALVRYDLLEVLEVSEAYPNRGDSRLVRVYVEARATADSGSVQPGGGER